MGGFGSGRRLDRRSIVEDSLDVAMEGFRGRLHHHTTGTIVWTWASGRKASIGYKVTWGEGPTITLQYRWQNIEDVQTLVRLQATPVQFGGQRWWFTCPLVANGVPCARRAGKLYLPPGKRYFGCRKCYGLTYRSCQESHQLERSLGSLGIDCSRDLRKEMFGGI